MITACIHCIDNVGVITGLQSGGFLESSYEWCAPRLLHLEVRNAVHRLERRGVISVGVLDKRVTLLESEIRFEESNDAALLSCIVTRARKASLSVFDATYLETAIRKGAALATRDATLLGRIARGKPEDLRSALIQSGGSSD